MIRRRGTSRGLDVGAFREAFVDGRVWGRIGTVTKREGEQAHWRIDEGDILVDVVVEPEGDQATCYFGSIGGAGIGVWRIPPVDSRVAILCVGGELDADPVIVAVLSSGTVPTELDGTTLLIKNVGGKIVLLSDDDITITATNKVVAINGNTHPLPKWDTFETDLSTLLGDISTALALGTGGSPIKQELVGLAALQASVTAFRGKLAGHNFDSTKGKNG